MESTHVSLSSKCWSWAPHQMLQCSLTIFSKCFHPILFSFSVCALAWPQSPNQPVDDSSRSLDSCFRFQSFSESFSILLFASCHLWHSGCHFYFSDSFLSHSSFCVLHLAMFFLLQFHLYCKLLIVENWILISPRCWLVTSVFVPRFCHAPASCLLSVELKTKIS